VFPVVYQQWGGGGKHKMKNGLMVGIYEVHRTEELRCQYIHTEFHKDWFGYLKVVEIYTYRHTAAG
jgi:hypothetical protein